MRPFVHDDFLLESDLARELFHGTAEGLPIIDYHCHLPVERIAADHRFRSVTEAWLEGDHYKWRAMRANGVAERYCTGDASDWEKFEAWAGTVPDTLRNPLYHWTHMELRRPFGIQELLDPGSARRIFDRCNERLQEPGFSAQGLLRAFKVAVVCTTDDPADSLAHHAALAARVDPDTQVYPTWRADRVLAVDDPAGWNGWLAALESAADITVARWADFWDALQKRHAAFHALGCRASDYGLEQVWADEVSEAEAASLFDRLRGGAPLEPEAARRLRSAVLHRLAVMDHARGWVQQFHLGALRNTNTRQRRRLGADAGFDSIGDFEMARPLARFLDRLDESDQLAKTVLYNLNPRDNELFATMAAIPGRLGGGKKAVRVGLVVPRPVDGMERQSARSEHGPARAVRRHGDGLRSFLSYSRHDYSDGSLNLWARRAPGPGAGRPDCSELVGKVAFGKHATTSASCGQGDRRSDLDDST